MDLIFLSQPEQMNWFVTIRYNESYLIANGSTDEYIINHVFVPASMRNRRIATTLIAKYAALCKEQGVRVIDLDDTSDRFRSDCNLYVSVGFAYVRDGWPEMRGDVDAVLSSAYKRCDEHVLNNCTVEQTWN